MIEITDKLREIFDKCSDNYYNSKEIHSLIINKKYRLVLRKLIKDNRLTMDEAKNLVAYYRTKSSEQYKIIEISIDEAKQIFHTNELRNPYTNDKMQSFEYHSQFKFLVLRGYNIKEVSLMLDKGDVAYFDGETCMYVHVDEVRQIWKIEGK